MFDPCFFLPALKPLGPLEGTVGNWSARESTALVCLCGLGKISLYKRALVVSVVFCGRLAGLGGKVRLRGRNWLRLTSALELMSLCVEFFCDMGSRHDLSVP